MTVVDNKRVVFEGISVHMDQKTIGKSCRIIRASRHIKKKRGCTCHFIVKVLYGRLDVAIFVLKQSLHVDKNGESCHGMDDTSNELHSHFVPNLSDECKAYRERLLLMDVSVDAIMDIHLDDPIFHDMLKKRDSFVTHKDVMNATTRVCSIQSRKHVHDATSILEWKNKMRQFFFSSTVPTNLSLWEYIRLGCLT
ncbi:hypothetical protein SUGI_0594520 [Cryptomeria japonica]|nr:hypothetical protein SUGI_0594520 [Cryptomeria japonica]